MVSIHFTRYLAMINHIKIFSLLLILIQGVLIIFYISQIFKKYRYLYLKPLIVYTIIINLYIAGLLWSLYYHTNYPEDFINMPGKFNGDIANILISIISIGLIYFISSVLLGFREKKINTRHRNRVVLICFIIALLYILRNLAPSLSVYFFWLDYIRMYIIENIVIFEIFLLILSCFFWPAGTDDRIKNLNRSLATIFILRYLLALLFLLFIKDASISETIKFIIAASTLILINSTPFIWVRFFFLRYAQQLIVIVKKRNNVDFIYSKYNITLREIEIIEMIIDGNSNRIIGDKLFISYHTVKNHITNIFAKLGVNSRLDLLHFFLKYEQESGSNI